MKTASEKLKLTPQHTGLPEELYGFPMRCS